MKKRKKKGHTGRKGRKKAKVDTGNTQRRVPRRIVKISGKREKKSLQQSRTRRHQRLVLVCPRKDYEN